DYFLVDLPPGTGDAQLSLTQSIHLDGAMIVTTPQEMAVGDSLRGAKMFERVGVRVVGVVENMSFYVCPHCGERSELFRAGGGERLAKELGVPLLGQVPLQAGVPDLADAGQPVVVAEPRSPAGDAPAPAARRWTSGWGPPWATAPASASCTATRGAPPRMARRCGTPIAACWRETPHASTAIWDSGSIAMGSPARAPWRASSRGWWGWGAAARKKACATCGASPVTATSPRWKARGCSLPRSSARPRATGPAARCCGTKRAPTCSGSPSASRRIRCSSAFSRRTS